MGCDFHTPLTCVDIFLFRYTFGKGVDGTAIATISNPSVTYWGYDRVARKSIEPRTIEIKSLTVSYTLLTQKPTWYVQYSVWGGGLFNPLQFHKHLLNSKYDTKTTDFAWKTQFIIIFR